MKNRFALTVSSLILSGSALAAECRNLSHYVDEPIDTLQGSDRYEYDLSSCDEMIVRKLHTSAYSTLPPRGYPDWRLVKEEIIPLVDGWVCVEQDQANGECVDKYRFFWNDARTELTRETFRKKAETGIATSVVIESESFTTKTFALEGDEVIVRGENRSKIRSAHTRNEWLAESRQFIHAYSRF